MESELVSVLVPPVAPCLGRPDGQEYWAGVGLLGGGAMRVVGLVP